MRRFPASFDPSTRAIVAACLLAAAFGLWLGTIGV